MRKSGGQGECAEVKDSLHGAQASRRLSVGKNGPAAHSTKKLPENIKTQVGQLSSEVTEKRDNNGLNISPMRHTRNTRPGHKLAAHEATFIAAPFKGRKTVALDYSQAGVF